MLTALALTKGLLSKPTQREPMLESEYVPLLRDSKNGFAPLERLFGTMEKGMAFGETAMNLENRKKFYHAIALTETWVLQIQKFDFENVVKEVEKKLVNEKVIFLKTIPEFGSIGLSRTKLVNLCK